MGQIHIVLKAKLELQETHNKTHARLKLMLNSLYPQLNIY